MSIESTNVDIFNAQVTDPRQSERERAPRTGWELFLKYPAIHITSALPLFVIWASATGSVLLIKNVAEASDDPDAYLPVLCSVLAGFVVLVMTNDAALHRFHYLDRHVQPPFASSALFSDRWSARAFGLLGILCALHWLPFVTWFAPFSWWTSLAVWLLASAVGAASFVVMRDCKRKRERRQT